MTVLTLSRRFLTDYARNPVNLLLLAVVPVVFVVVAGSMASAAKLFGGTGGPAVETAVAGWAAAFLASIAMYFQTAATRDTDRRLVIAGLLASRLVLARLFTRFALAVFASAVALIALAARTGIGHPVRVAFGTLMFAVIYVSVGSVVGSLTRNPINGTAIVLFIWILDGGLLLHKLVTVRSCRCGGRGAGKRSRCAGRCVGRFHLCVLVCSEPSV